MSAWLIVPAEKRPLVYYARGPRGLQTGLKGSINVESLERIGARNVAAERMGPGGIVTVSPEQLLAWNPEVVITIESDFFTAARSDDIWKGVKAFAMVASMLRRPSRFPGSIFRRRLTG